LVAKFLEDNDTVQVLQAPDAHYAGAYIVKTIEVAADKTAEIGDSPGLYLSVKWDHDEEGPPYFIRARCFQQLVWETIFYTSLESFQTLTPIEQEIVRRYIEEFAELHSLMQKPEGPIGACNCSAKDFPISWVPGACLTAHLLQSDGGKQLVGDGAKVNAQLWDTPWNPQELHMLALLLENGEFTQANQTAASQWIGEGAGEGASGSGAARANVTGKAKKAARKGGSGSKATEAAGKLQVVSFSLGTEAAGEGGKQREGRERQKGGKDSKGSREDHERGKGGRWPV
jgi:hypothetical protein